MRLNKEVRLLMYKEALELINSHVSIYGDYLFGFCYALCISKFKFDWSIPSNINKYPELMSLKKKYNISTNRKTKYWNIDTSFRIKLLEECISMLEHPQTLKK